MKSRPAAFAVLTLTLAFSAYAQRERQIPPPDEPSTAQSDYGAKFFEELQRIFGRFRDSDLKRVFDSARAVQCSELVTDKGEWREVAFFNENRKLGDWYRQSLDEVKGDLAVYIFKGGCGGPRAPVQVTTKFPVEESYRRAADGKIPYDRIDVNVNAPVSGIYDPKTQAYTFDLPYLYHVRSETGEMVYSLNPRTLDDRYDPTVTNHWDCKAVTADDVTYQFLICHNQLQPREARASRYTDQGGFGSAAYSILSDGKEALSTVHLSFGDAEPAKEPAPAASAPRSADRSRNEPARGFPPESATPSRTWRPVSSQARLNDAGQSEFRLRFKPEIWRGKIDKPELVQDGMLAPFTVAPRNKDYCIWRPRVPAQAGQLLEPSTADSTIPTLEFRKDAQGVFAVFDLESDSGSNLGSLQCSFAQSQSPSDVTVARWMSIVGSAIGLESPGR